MSTLDPYHVSQSNGAAEFGTLGKGAPGQPFDDSLASFRGREPAATLLRASATNEPLRAERDAFEAAFFRVPRTAVLGLAGVVDDTTAYPSRAIAFLDICTVRDGVTKYWRGTAFFVSPYTLLTAGHNVFFHDYGGWPRTIDVHPGRNSGGSPFGKAVSKRFYSVRGWLEGRDPAYDYGAIVLDSDLGSSLGYFGLHEPDVSEFLRELTLAGYPTIQGEQVAGDGYAQPGPSTESRLYYDVPTAIGQSGAPVWFKDDPLAIAVHAYESGTYNSGVRMNAAVRAQVTGWRR